MRPPLRARTRCSVSPATRLYSAAVLSSVLERIWSAILRNQAARTQGSGSRGQLVHLLAAVNQALLNWRDAFLLLDLLLDLGDLQPSHASASVLELPGRQESDSHLVVHLDVQLNLLPRQCSDSARKSILVSCVGA